MRIYPVVSPGKKCVHSHIDFSYHQVRILVRNPPRLTVHRACTGKPILRYIRWIPVSAPKDEKTIQTCAETSMRTNSLYCLVFLIPSVFLCSRLLDLRTNIYSFLNSFTLRPVLPRLL